MRKKSTKILFAFFACWLVATSTEAQKPKYIFFFIGDGMGINHVEATNYFLSNSVKDVKNHLLFTQFPFSGYASTHSASHFITCSAAGGTALATGTKTTNNSVGMDEKGVALSSVLSNVQKLGWKTGVITTEGLNDATPAAFYAHHFRKDTDSIAFEAAESKIDFLGGASFLKTKNKKDQTDTILTNFKNRGYDLLKGPLSYDDNKKYAKVLMIPDVVDQMALPYALDRMQDDLQLSHLTEAAIKFLNKDNSLGFFLMVEGGEIDHAAHVNDLGTVIREVIDFDYNIKLAYQFYLKHPEETLIVVTADHETGGLGLGTNYTTLNLQALAHQKMSINKLSTLLRNMKEKGSCRWEEVAQVLKTNLGFWEKIEISEKDEQSLKNTFNSSFIVNRSNSVNTLYSKDEPLAVEAFQILNSISEVGWTTKSHSASPVPVYSIGAGAEKFSGRMNNIDIPKKIIEIIDSM